MIKGKNFCDKWIDRRYVADPCGKPDEWNTTVKSSRITDFSFSDSGNMDANHKNVYLNHKNVHGHSGVKPTALGLGGKPANPLCEKNLTT